MSSTIRPWRSPRLIRSNTALISSSFATSVAAFVEHGPDGVHGFKGRYREVTPPERVVQSFEWDGMPGHVAVETMTLEDLGDGRTKLVTVSLFHTTEERDGMLHSGMEQGLNQGYAALDKVLATLG